MMDNNYNKKRKCNNDEYNDIDIFGEDNKHVVKIEFEVSPSEYCILYENAKRYFCFKRKANLTATINAVDPPATGGSYHWNKDDKDDMKYGIQTGASAKLRFGSVINPNLKNYWKIIYKPDEMTILYEAKLKISFLSGKAFFGSDVFFDGILVLSKWTDSIQPIDLKSFAMENGEYNNNNDSSVSIRNETLRNSHVNSMEANRITVNTGSFINLLL